MKEILLALLFLLIIAYAIYQTKRVDKIYEIRLKWIFENDPRIDIYSFWYMSMSLNKYNWYGLRWPKEKHWEI